MEIQWEKDGETYIGRINGQQIGYVVTGKFIEYLPCLCDQDHLPIWLPPRLGLTDAKDEVARAVKMAIRISKINQETGNEFV